MGEFRGQRAQPPPRIIPMELGLLRPISPRGSVRRINAVGVVPSVPQLSAQLSEILPAFVNFSALRAVRIGGEDLPREVEFPLQ